jgi:hypothetical protein
MMMMMMMMMITIDCNERSKDQVDGFVALLFLASSFHPTTDVPAFLKKVTYTTQCYYQDIFSNDGEYMIETTTKKNNNNIPLFPCIEATYYYGRYNSSSSNHKNK